MNEREKFIRQADSELEKLLKRIQRFIFRRLSSIIDDLETQDGVIGFNPGNAAATSKLTVLFQDLRNTGGGGLAKFIVRKLLRLLRLNGSYFKQFSNQKNETVKDLVLKSIGYDAATGIIEVGGWLDRVTDVNPVRLRVASVFSSGLTQDLSIKEFKKKIKDLVIGGDKIGLVEKQVMGVAGRIFARYDRMIGLHTAQKLGLQHAQYSGTLKDNTREFCSQRLNRVYSYDFIVAMNNLMWKGKIIGGDVLVDCGGYYCRHIWNWISNELMLVLTKNKPLNSYNF